MRGKPLFRESNGIRQLLAVLKEGEQSGLLADDYVDYEVGKKGIGGLGYTGGYARRDNTRQPSPQPYWLGLAIMACSNSTVSFDTHKFVRRLKEAGFPEAQAEALTEAFREAQGEAALATKADVTELRQELKADINAVELRLLQALSELKADLQKTIIYSLVAMTAIFSAIVKLF